MANAFNATQAVEVAGQMLVQDSFLSALIARDNSNAFFSGGGAKGRTVDVKIPTTLIARQRGIDDKTSAIVVDEISESMTSITLGTHVYNAIGLSEGDLTLNIKDYAAQVLRPQMDAVSEGVEELVANALLATPQIAVGGATPDPAYPAYSATDPIGWLTAVRKLLRDKGIPLTGLNVVVGTQVYADLLNTAQMTDASQSGSTSALKEGAVGRVRGLTIVESTRVPDDDVLAFHRDAFMLASRAPLVPQGATFGATKRSNGYDLRYLRDYDADHTQDRSILSTFAGVAKMPFYTITRDYATSTASVVEDPQGAVYHFDTKGDADAAPAVPATDA